MTERTPNDERTAADLQKVLNSHGYGFHYALLRHLDNLWAKGQADWIWHYKVSEFPVVVANETTHVDFILRGYSRWGDRKVRAYLIAECKRVKPGFSRWCFARAPYTDGNLVFDRCRFYRNADSETLNAPLRVSTDTRPPYHLGFELKSNAPENGGAGRGAINDATAQVLRGSSGLINYELHNRRSEDELLNFLPVIFTTAELWTTEADLGNAAIDSGNLEALSCEKRDWIWFNHNRSSRLRHDVRPIQKTELDDALLAEFTRTVAIVSTTGIESFFSTNFANWLFG